MIEPLGSHTLLTGTVAGQQIRVVAPSDTLPAQGATPALAPGAGSRSAGWTRPPGASLGRSAHDRSQRTRRARILRANDRGGYSVPTARLYPFQWNWDSAFVAMGWATFDEARAWDEIESLLKGQWDDGLIPQIVFHAPSDDYFPGPEVWGIAAHAADLRHHPAAGAGDRGGAPARGSARPGGGRGARACRSIRGCSQTTAGGKPRATLTRTGLVATLHPWETGMDNSPAWDCRMARVPTETTTIIRRRDTSHVDPAMRPRAEDYRALHPLGRRIPRGRLAARRMLAVSPFRMADVGTNAILLRAERDLLTLASRFGTAPEQAEIAARVARLHAAIGRLWHADLGVFTCFDLIGDAPVPIGTSAGFLPLFASAATEIQVAALGATLTRWAARAAWLVPSTDPGDVRFEPLRYWRGPVWAVINWMVADGFAATGDPAIAGRIRAQTLELIETAGFAEYFDPITGRGAGGKDFSWTAAVWLLLQAGG